jgi:hypothetical protein
MNSCQRWDAQSPKCCLQQYQIQIPDRCTAKLIIAKGTYSPPYLVLEKGLENCKHRIKVEWLIDHMESFEPQGKCLLETIKTACYFSIYTIRLIGVRLFVHVTAVVLVCYFKTNNSSTNREKWKYIRIIFLCLIITFSCYIVLWSF